jgi:hypothetical protein
MGSIRKTLNLDLTVNPFHQVFIYVNACLDFLTHFTTTDYIIPQHIPIAIHHRILQYREVRYTRTLDKPRKKTSIVIRLDLCQWIEEQKEKGRFQSFSHAIEIALEKLRDAKKEENTR